MEQNKHPLFIAFQQGYARRNSQHFSRDWEEFKMNYATLFEQQPSLSGVEWVKATLRLPTVCGWVVLKYPNHKANGFYWFDGEGFPEVELTEDTIWLDESASPPLIKGDSA